MTNPSAEAHAVPDAAPRVDPAPAGRILDPIDRISEVLFGLIMALTFTLAIDAAQGGTEEVRTLLVGAIACNIAWGIVDGAMYLLARLVERGAARRAVRAFHEAADPAQARAVVVGALPPAIAAAIGPAELESLRGALSRNLPALPGPRLRGEDWLGAVGVFLLVVLSTFPVVVPFLFADDARRALRLSNGVAVAMMFLCGWAFGKVAGCRPWVTGLAMVALGVALVAVTVALGG